MLGKKKTGLPGNADKLYIKQNKLLDEPQRVGAPGEPTAHLVATARGQEPEPEPEPGGGGPTGMPLVSRMRLGTCRADRPTRMALRMLLTSSGSKLWPEAIFRKSSTLSSPSLLYWGTHRLSITSSKASTAETGQGATLSHRPTVARGKGGDGRLATPPPRRSPQGEREERPPPARVRAWAAAVDMFIRSQTQALFAYLQTNLKMKKKQVPTVGTPLGRGGGLEAEGSGLLCPGCNLDVTSVGSHFLGRLILWPWWGILKTHG